LTGEARRRHAGAARRRYPSEAKPRRRGALRAARQWTPRLPQLFGLSLRDLRDLRGVRIFLAFVATYRAFWPWESEVGSW